MKVRVFSVLDAKVGAFAQPWFSATLGSGIRAFVEAARDPNTTLAKHPADFELWQLGEFDDSTGEFLNDRQNLGNAAALIKE